MKYLHDHGIVSQDLKCVSPPFILHPIFVELVGSNVWLVDRPQEILFRTKDPSSDVVIALRNHSRSPQDVWDMSLQRYSTR